MWITSLGLGWRIALVEAIKVHMILVYPRGVSLHPYLMKSILRHLFGIRYVLNGCIWM